MSIKGYISGAVAPQDSKVLNGMADILDHVLFPDIDTYIIDIGKAAATLQEFIRYLESVDDQMIAFTIIHILKSDLPPKEKKRIEDITTTLYSLQGSHDMMLEIFSKANGKLQESMRKRKSKKDIP